MSTTSQPHLTLALSSLLLCLLLGACGDQSSAELSAPGLSDIAGLPPSAATASVLDSDSDGLSDEDEKATREIYIDTGGFGIAATRANLEARTVSSDPNDDDSDDDGLTDLEEYLIRTDPMHPDTDRDGLSDYDEWFRWLTSPVSVDSDSDARGPTGDGPPNASLFDFAELEGTGKGATSPTLEDTDGDGKTDAEEIDHPFRSPLIAELPKVQLELVGVPDIRLFVEYDDARGSTEEYSSVLTTSRENTRSSSHSLTEEQHRETSAFAQFRVQQTAGLKDNGAEFELTVGASQTWGSSSALTTTYETTSTHATAREAGRYWSTSSTRTEIAASGEIRLDFKIKNLSDSISYRMTQLGIAVRMWVEPKDPREPGRFQTMAVLAPQGFDSFTLSPGAESGVLPAIATGVNPDLIKAFLARPERLAFEPVYYDLENGEGLNFDFLTEHAFSQTALIELDVGEGSPTEYRVATNVQRSKPNKKGKGGGQYRGISLREAMEDILGHKLQTVTRDVTFDGITKSVELLSSVEGYASVRSPIEATFVGKVDFSPKDTTVTITQLKARGEDTLTDVAELDEGYEDDLIGRTLILNLGGGKRKVARIIVAAVDASAGEFQIHERIGEGRRGLSCEITDLYQVEPHADPEDPDRPAAVEPSPEQAFWLVIATDKTAAHPHTNFGDIVLRAGDQVRLAYWVDRDGDGVSSRVEIATGTSDSGEKTKSGSLSADCDGDGLMDGVETIRGWIAGAPSVLPIERLAFFDVVDDVRDNPNADHSSDSPEDQEWRRLRAKLILNDPARGYPRLVKSLATATNSDDDELDDLFECIKGTDPTRADTDGDGLEDHLDPFPLHPARILHVNLGFVPAIDSAGETITPPDLLSDERGLSWDTAFLHLQDALEAARARNASDDYDVNGEDKYVDEEGVVLEDQDDVAARAVNPGNDISAIWVTGGIHKPDTWSESGPAADAFESDGKSPRNRSYDLVPNVTIYGGFVGTEERLSDRQDDALATTLSGAVDGGRAMHVVRAGREDDDSGAAITRLAGLDRVTIEGGGEKSSDGGSLGGGFVNEGGKPTLRNVLFINNVAIRGGAVYEGPGSRADSEKKIAPAGRYIDCVFTSNEASETGGAMCFVLSRAVLNRCSFENNTAPRREGGERGWGDGASKGDGGGIAGFGGGHLHIEECQFRNHEANRGAALFLRLTDAMVRDCKFTGNSTDPGTRDSLKSQFRHWVLGLSAVVNGGRVDRIRQSSDLGEIARKDWGDYGDIENFGAGNSVAREGDRITFGPGTGAVKGLGELEKSGNKPEWSPPANYLDKFDEKILSYKAESGSEAAGGAIFCSGKAQLAIVQCVFHENSASVGGAIAAHTLAPLTIIGSTFSRNKGLGLAGAVFLASGQQEGSMVNCILAGATESIWERPKKPDFKINKTHTGRKEGGDPYKLFGLFPYWNAEAGSLGGAEYRFPGGDIKRSSGEYYADGWRSLSDFTYRSGYVPRQLHIENGSFSVEYCLLRDDPKKKKGGRFEDGQSGNRVGGNTGSGEIALENPNKVSGLSPLPESHAIDAGLNFLDYDPFVEGTQPAPETDIAGRPRRWGGIDIGAYEYSGE